MASLAIADRCESVTGRAGSVLACPKITNSSRSLDCTQGDMFL
jgi:hypothetical protein